MHDTTVPTPQALADALGPEAAAPGVGRSTADGDAMLPAAAGAVDVPAPAVDAAQPSLAMPDPPAGTAPAQAAPR